MDADIFTQTNGMNIQLVIAKENYMKNVSIQYQDSILMERSRMNKETTIDDWANFLKKEVCSTCKFYKKDFDV